MKLTDEEIDKIALEHCDCKLCQGIREFEERKSSVDWNKLREEFFSECTDNIYCNDGNNKLVVNMSPHDLFNWFKNKIEK